MDIKLSCRVCLQELSLRKCIKLEDKVKETTYLEIFQSVTGHSVDILSEPDKVCLSCGDRLVQAFDLRKLCDATQIYLKTRINEIKQEETDEIDVKVEIFEAEPYSEPESVHVKIKKKEKRVTKAKVTKNEKKLCPICGIFRTQKHVQEHIDRSNNLDTNGERPYMCDLCGRQTASRNNMFLHMQTMHLRVMMKCKHCMAEFKNRGRLETHMRKIHPEIKGLLECKFCEYRAVDRSTLHVHLRKHTGQKPHRCEICHHEFITKTKWRDHMATHSDERPFTCETCNATFKTRKTMNSHKKIHLAHDYECPVCGHTYQTSHQLRVHVTKCHPEYPLPPPGTVLSKSWRKRKAEQEMKDLAMKQGMDQKTVEGITVKDVPPIKTKQYFQEFC